MGALDGFLPIDFVPPKRTGKWDPRGIVQEFLATGNPCMAKEFDDKNECAKIVASIRQYVYHNKSLKSCVSVHKRDNTVILCSHNDGRV